MNPVSDVIPLFEIGEVVRVVDTPYEDAPCGWVDAMDKFCGKEVTIEQRRDDAPFYNGEIAYRIKGSRWSWSSRCFVSIGEDIPDIDDSSFTDLIFAR